jgi:hypothetical protein
MARVITDARRNSLEASASDDFDLLLVRLGGADLHKPIGICNDSVNYYYDGVIYYGMLAEIALISDGDRPPRSRVRMRNIDGQVGKFLQELPDSPRLTLWVFSDNDWSTELTDTGLVDDNGDAIRARYPLATPTINYTADWLRLKNVQGDAIAVEADLWSFDPTGEPYPAIRSTQDRLPALFR